MCARFDPGFNGFAQTIRSEREMHMLYVDIQRTQVYACVHLIGPKIGRPGPKARPALSFSGASEPRRGGRFRRATPLEETASSEAAPYARPRARIDTRCEMAFAARIGSLSWCCHACRKKSSHSDVDIRLSLTCLSGDRRRSHGRPPRSKLALSLLVLDCPGLLAVRPACSFGIHRCISTNRRLLRDCAHQAPNSNKAQLKRHPRKMILTQRIT